MLHREMLQARHQMSRLDIAESRQLLWELLNNESTVQQCLNIAQSTCLAYGVRCFIDNEPCAPDFQAFVDRHYGEFCQRAIRAFFGYGFVPWIVRKDAKGNDIPEVLPDGSFYWETVPAAKTGGTLRTPLVSYSVQLMHNVNVEQKDVHIYEFTPATLNVASGSFLNATVSSPLSQILVEYKEMRQAQIRAAYADAWNTTAKVICTYAPKHHAQDEPTAALMDFADAGMYGLAAGLGVPLMPSLAASNLTTRDAQIRKQFADVVTHVPYVFTLPRDHDIANQIVLKGRDDIPFLWEKYQRGVASIMHIPFDMIYSQGGMGRDTIKKTTSSGKLFTNQMARLCMHLEYLLKDVYDTVYKGKNVQFKLRPFRRLEVESIDDLKVLYEIGALTNKHTLDISSLLNDVVAAEKKRAV